MEEEEEISSPFWLQSSSNHRRGRRRGPSSSFLLNSGVLLVVLLVLALAFIFITIPSFLSFTSQIKPQSVKKSWDSLNLVLVLFAIVCGFLSRNNTTNNESASSVAITTTPTYEEEDRHYKFSERSESFQKPNPTTPRRFWYDHHDQYNSSDVNRVHNGHNNSYGTLNRLRSFRSHPDLRQEEASWGISSRDDHQWRFYDDTHLYNNSYRSSTSNYYYQQQLQLHQWRRPEQKLEAEAEQERTKEKNVKEKESENNAVDEAKNMGADDATSVVESQKDIIYTPPSPPASSPPPPRRSPSPTPMLPRPRSPSPTPIQPPPPQANKLVRRKVVKRTNPDLGKRERKNEQYQSSTSQPPQHPPVPAVVEEGSAKNEKKRGSATSATKEFLTSLRRNKKKKKQRQKSVENLDSFFNYESSYTLPSSTIPPPPPPPPPFFHNLFSLKKHKAKNIHSVIPTPPPPPPRTQKLSISSASQSRVENLSFTTQKLPLQVKIKNYRNNVEENVGSCNESPLNSIPPPPPLPPFKMPAWKYEVHGDFVRLKSNISDDAEEASSPSDAGGDSTMSPFCPSPDVDTKADNFIARFRAGLRLEKMNSVRGKSNLGPDASPSEGVSPS